MATHDYVIDNSTGANVRTDINNALAAIQSNNSNSSSPATTVAYQWWADTNAAIMKIRNSSNNAWINLFTLAGGIDVDAASNFNEDVTFTTSNGNNILFDKSDNAIEFGDDCKAKFGDDTDLEIFYQNSTNVNKINSHRELQLFSNGNTTLFTNNADTMVKGIKDGAVELYFDNAIKLATLTTGVDITGDLIIDGAAGGTLTLGGSSAHTSKLVIADNTGSSNGNLLVEGGDGGDFFTINSAGNVKFEDNKKALFGAGADLELFHNGTNSFISNQTGNLQIDSDAFVQVNSTSFRVKNAGDTELCATFTQNSECQLFFDNSEKLNTSSAGVFVHGTIGSQPPDKDTRGMSLSSYVVDINQAGQTVATAKINSNMGVCLDLNRFYTTGNIAEFRINNDFEGAISVSPTGVSYNTTSDYRLKENVVALSDGITRFKQLKPYRFNFIAEPSVLHDGFFAHEVSSIVPSAVSGEKDATEIRYYEEGDILPSGKVIGDIKDENSVVPQSLDYAKIVPLITAALQESIAKIEVLETKVAALEAA